MSRVMIAYSIWRSEIGAVAAARRMASALASLRPMCRTYPCSTSSAIAPTVSSIGTPGSTRAIRYTSMWSTPRRCREYAAKFFTAAGRPS